MLRVPHCLDNQLTDGGKVVSPTHRLFVLCVCIYIYIYTTQIYIYIIEVIICVYDRLCGLVVRPPGC
jgi:hypothetical protein